MFCSDCRNESGRFAFSLENRQRFASLNKCVTITVTIRLLKRHMHGHVPIVAPTAMPMGPPKRPPTVAPVPAITPPLALCFTETLRFSSFANFDKTSTKSSGEIRTVPAIFLIESKHRKYADECESEAFSK